MPPSLPKTGIPEDLNKQLDDNETLYFFSPVVFKGGCLGFGTSEGNYWAALTDKRFLYHAKVQDKSVMAWGQPYVEREGTLQFKNITSMEIAEVKPQGCLSSPYWELRVNAQGAIIGLPFPNKGKGLEIRAIHHELTEGQE
jgi:hypothetical protein